MIRGKRKTSGDAAEEVQRWFAKSVTYEGEPYIIDMEQAAAVADDSFNTIVVARAGSGKTRTLVAKIVYLIAKCGVGADEIIAFVFNHNAAVEINERLSKMMVDGKLVVERPEVATTFHAFARRVVYDVCGGRKKCKGILAEQKGGYIEVIVREILKERGKEMEEAEVMKLAGQMVVFVNRAQQQFLNGDNTLMKSVEERLAGEIDEDERKFLKLGVEVYRRYHWYLLDAKRGLPGYGEYGTDFNLIVSWASRLVASGRKEVVKMLRSKKYILIDEYQDFSQLFLAAVEAIRGVAVGARLFVVGDDWQAINRFAGSEVGYFKNFGRYFGEGYARYEITTNYRCDKAVVETARRFMRKEMNEKGDFGAFSRKYGKVTVVNPRETELGFALVPYDKRVSNIDKLMKMAAMRMGRATVKKAVVRYLKTVVEIIEENRDVAEIMILHRNNELSAGGVSLSGFGEGLKWALGRLGVMGYDEFDSKVRLMTMHKSKGLEAEMVIILEADEGVIPKSHPDTRLYAVFGETEEVALDDQKRLFYVAMTRAKKRLYILSEGGGFVKCLGKG